MSQQSELIECFATLSVLYVGIIILITGAFGAAGSAGISVVDIFSGVMNGAIGVCGVLLRGFDRGYKRRVS